MKSIREGIDIPTSYGTMFDGGGEIEPDPEKDPEPGSEKDPEPGAGDEESYELYGNKYAKDDDGIAKLIEDSKNMERSLTDKSNQLTRLEGLVDSKEPTKEGGDPDNKDGQKLKYNYPFDVNELTPEDQQNLKVLEGIVETQVEQRVKERMEPLLDNQSKSEIKDELREIEDQYGPVADKKALVKFAYDHHMNSLVDAYKTLNFDGQIGKGRAAERADMARKKGAGLPTGKQSSGRKVPKYDPKVHGKKSIHEILEEELKDV